ncbi:MAG TPA: MaoC/PaaZ C-terminal domain-containing protein [Novosphingobium sp.]|nr:MaoC/PaaZ C-terminal domain-containing protein [Novosphingobium sp.]
MMRRFDDLVVGERRTSAGLVIDEQAIIAFAQDFDPQWFHVDPLAARGSAFGGLIASGAHLLALWRRMDHDLNGDIDYYCGVGMENVRFRKAVRPGDRLTLESEIAECRPSASDAGRGLVRMAYRMTNGAGDVVLDLEAINLVYRGAAA